MICISFFGVESIFLFSYAHFTFGFNVFNEAAASLWVLFLWLGDCQAPG